VAFDYRAWASSLVRLNLSVTHSSIPQQQLPPEQVHGNLSEGSTAINSSIILRY